MTFTDDELKRLKADLLNPEASVILNGDDISAILARLEAAEKCVQEHFGHGVLDCEPNCTVYEAWRKAKGDGE